MVGNLWSTKADYRTWFGANIDFVHFIHVRPFTPITYEVLDFEFVKKQYPVASKATAQGEWLSYIIMDEAVIDPNSAFARANSTAITDFGYNSRANTLWWIVTRKDPPQPAGFVVGMGGCANSPLTRHLRSPAVRVQS